jgi:filamentous hemagglutinin family protein
MNMAWRQFWVGLGSVGLVGGAIAPPAIAQPILPANDGTQTHVTVTGSDGNTFVIDGGQRSADGANLFHSFQEFGLNAGQIADFRAKPELQNILARVTGGNASMIDGLMRVSGGGADLMLINPAGIVFGAGARLDVPGSFAATTATGIGFDGDRWFNATGPINAAELLGTPAAFRFDLTTPGSVINLGNLAVPAGEQLSLIGGSVLNGGTLSAPGGTLTAIAVPGGKLVRLGQAGHILTLDIPISAIDPATGLSPLALPELLTGNATGTDSATSFPEAAEPGTT